MTSWPLARPSSHDTSAGRSSSGLRALNRLTGWPSYAAIAAGLIALQALGINAVIAAFIGLAGWAMLGPRQAIETLSLVWTVGFLNTGFFTAGARLALVESDTLLPLKWGVLLVAAGSCISRAIVRRESPPGTVVWITLFAAIACIASLVTSAFPVISVAKLVSFWLGAATVLLGFHLSRSDLAHYEEWFLGLAVALVLWNLPLLFESAMYRRQDHLFMGLFGHPQFTALVFVPLLAWLLGRFISDARTNPVVLLTALGAFAVVWPTGSRTAVFALVLSLVAAVVLRWLVERPTLRQVVAVFGRARVAVVVLIAMVAAAAYGDVVAGKVVQFIQKRPAPVAVGAEAGVWSTRRHLIDAQWRNFVREPLFGNGFGVASNLNQVRVIRNPTTGLPMGAATEKGFLPTAVLEETGVVGAALLLLALVSLYRTVALGCSFSRLWLAVTAMAVNLGESVFFSFGGVGLFLWVLIGFATIPEANSPAGRSAG